MMFRFNKLSAACAIAATTLMGAVGTAQAQFRAMSLRSD